jgi:hypothetical protein
VKLKSENVASLVQVMIYKKKEIKKGLGFGKKNG